MTAQKTEAEQAGILVLGKIAANMADVFVPLLIVRLLLRSEVGMWAALMVAYHTLATMFSAGFPAATLYTLAGKSPGERRTLVIRLTKILLVLGVMTALLLLGVGVVSSWWPFGETSGSQESTLPLDLLAILALYPLFDLPVRLMAPILLSEGRARSSAGLEVLRSLLNTAAVLIPAALGFGVHGIIIGTVALGAVMFAVYVVILSRHYREAPRDTPAPSARELIRVALPIGATDIVATLNNRLDSWLIILFFTADAVAQYQIGAWQIPVITTLAYATGNAYLPRLTELFREGRAAEALSIWRTTAEKVSLITVPVCFVFVVGADPFIRVAFGNDYERSANVFRFYSLLTAARVTAFGSVILATGKPAYVLRSAVWALVANALLSLPALWVFGFIGPAFATALAFIPTVISYCYYIARASGVRLGETFPFVAYLKTVALTLVPSAAAIVTVRAVEWPPAVEFGVIAAIVLSGFALLGTLTGKITKGDWKFAGDWLRLRVLR